MAGNVAAGKEFRALLEDNDLMLYGQNAPPQKRKSGRRSSARKSRRSRCAAA
jgi:hypothetical protein